MTGRESGSTGIPPAQGGEAGGPQDSPLERRTRILYSLGDIPNAIKMVLAGLFGLYFYTSVMGLSGTLVGIAAVIGLLWDALIDPYIGHLSDHSQARLGKRHLFMLVGALTMGIGFWLSFSPPRNLSTAGLFAWLLLTGFLVRSASSVYRVPYFALGAELSTDYDERTSITGLRGILALAGTLGAAGLAFVVFFPNRITGVDPKLDYDGYFWMGLVFGGVMTVIALLTTCGTLPARSHSRSLPSQHGRRLSREFLRSSARTLCNRSFRMLLISIACFSLAAAINGALSIHFLSYYARITDSSALSLFQAAFYLAGLIGLVVWLRISRSTDKHILYIIGTLGGALLLFAAFLLLGEGHLLSFGNVPAVVLIHALGGFCGSVLWFLPATMIADVVDEDELQTGERREGSFFGCYSLGQQLAFGMSMLLTGVLLDRFAGLVPGQADQSGETTWRIGVLYCLLPALLMVLAAVSMMRYGLGRKKVQAIQIQLQNK